MRFRRCATVAPGSASQTDVAARGIDLPNLELVIHAELPSNADSLLHRSGRTGRAGRKGISALVVPPKAVKRAERLLASARVTADWITAPGADEILRRDEERLLADPDWSMDVTDEEAAFAHRLLALYSPEAIAAAYLRQYRARHSAPEELVPVDTRPAAKAHARFGPSVWFTLSVGRDDGAEPRWLLPLACVAPEGSTRMRSAQSASSNPRPSWKSPRRALRNS